MSDIELFEYWKDDQGRVFAFDVNLVDNPPNLEGLVKLTDDEVEAHLNPIPSMWTNGIDLREAFNMDLPGWRLATQEEVDELVHQAAAQAATMRIAELRQVADVAIIPLQDALDLDRISDEKRALLTAWKIYRIELSEIPEQATYPDQIEWPNPPA